MLQALILALSLLNFSQASDFKEADLWSLVDARFQKNHICEAYVDGASYLIEYSSCTKLSCDKWQYTQKTFCSDEGARIESWNRGTLFSKLEISTADWQKIKGNMLRHRAIYNESFGYVFTLVDAKTEPSSGELHVQYQITARDRVFETGTWILGHGPTIPTLLMQQKTKTGFLKEVTTERLIR